VLAREDDAEVRRQLTGSAMRPTAIDTPFFDETHRALAVAVDAFAASRPSGVGAQAPTSDVDAACRRWVRDLGEATAAGGVAVAVTVGRGVGGAAEPGVRVGTRVAVRDGVFVGRGVAPGVAGFGVAGSAWATEHPATSNGRAGASVRNARRDNRGR
jgi:hypothetical protein